MKKVAVIQDLSSFGKCSLTAALPVLSVMGSQACPLPTAVLTAQTGFSSYYCKDLTNEMVHYTDEWSNMGAAFDGIQTGYVTGEKQIAHIFHFLELFHRDKTKLLVDPVLGDDGQLYKMFSTNLVDQMQVLVKTADIITPNITECCLLTGISYEKIKRYKDQKSFFQAVEEAGRLLQQQTNAHVIVTGISMESSNEIGNLYVDAEQIYLKQSAYNGESYSGTGDLFSSIMMGGMMRGQSIKETMVLAQQFLQAAITTTSLTSFSPKEGIHFEQHLNLLF
ncbi:MAG: pyridoxamine kinase [Kurthia sp.]|nr:pyridoxamine kinase [Candidatus Kurthia equi]